MDMKMNVPTTCWHWLRPFGFAFFALMLILSTPKANAISRCELRLSKLELLEKLKLMREKADKQLGVKTAWRVLNPSRADYPNQNSTIYGFTTGQAITIDRVIKDSFMEPETWIHELVHTTTNRKLMANPSLSETRERLYRWGRIIRFSKADGSNPLSLEEIYPSFRADEYEARRSQGAYMTHIKRPIDSVRDCNKLAQLFLSKQKEILGLFAANMAQLDIVTRGVLELQANCQHCEGYEIKIQYPHIFQNKRFRYQVLVDHFKTVIAARLRFVTAASNTADTM
jgi:hypothetical protein